MRTKTLHVTHEPMKIGETLATLDAWLPELPQGVRSRILTMLPDGDVRIREFADAEGIVGYAIAHDVAGHGSTRGQFSTGKFYRHWLRVDAKALAAADAWARSLLPTPTAGASR